MNLTELRGEERAALCSTLRQVGPAGPTLCAGWSSSDLAAHLVVSERYFGLPMVMAYPLRRVLPMRVRERAMASFQQVGDKQMESLKRRGWDWLLHRVEAGPPRSYRMGWVAPFRLIEEWIHHEDVRRANEMPLRSLSPEFNEALWQAALFVACLPELLPNRRGLEVEAPDGRRHRIGDATRVLVSGDPGELLLFLSGRVDAARVDVRGDESDVEEFTQHLAV
jgi:uncharacterized protein (TIGR03085 family)